MAFIPQQSPWSQADDLGASFSRLMLNLAQIKAQQVGQQRSAEMQQAEMAQRQPLIDSQVAENQARAGLLGQQQRDASTNAGRADDVGLAAFGRTLAGTPGYDPNQTSFLPNTPEVQRLIQTALLQRGLYANAATSPTAAASLLRPIEANRDTAILEALSGAVLGKGPESPERPIALAPGAALFSPQGQQIAQNPLSRSNDLPTLVSALRGALGTVGQLGEQNALGEAPYMTDPNLGQVFTNALNLANVISPQLMQRFGGTTNAPSFDSEQAARASGAKAGDIVTIKGVGKVRLK